MKEIWKKYQSIIVTIILFVLTFITSVFAGAEWRGLYELNGFDWWLSGMSYAISFIGILLMHEMGHYLVSRYYKVDTTYPMFIPMYFPGIPSIGTLGAIIRIKSVPKSRRQFFDIGVAGPLAGFIVASIILIIGFISLPAPEYVFKIHPDYEKFGIEFSKHVYTQAYRQEQYLKERELYLQKDSLEYIEHLRSNRNIKPYVKPEVSDKYEGSDFAVGENIMIVLLKEIFSYQGNKIPNAYEWFHYPLLFAGYLALFFTALNLLPIGQLDGGHVIYGLFGPKVHSIVSPLFFSLIVILGGVGFFRDNILGIDFFQSNMSDKLLFVLAYLSLLHFIYAKIYSGLLNTLTASTIVFAIQFVITWIFPTFTGFIGWFVFSIVLGRFVGVGYPYVFDNQSLDTKRKIAGWLAIIVFVICFTPAVFV
jgi:membrane-associated protease RseP (regulator of RpoE activity)